MELESYDRFVELRQIVMMKIRRALEEDSYCKSYEGSFDIVLSHPTYFEDKTGTRGVDVYGILLDCYVLGPSRHYEWWGETFEEALSKAEVDIYSW